MVLKVSALPKLSPNLLIFIKIVYLYIFPVIFLRLTCCLTRKIQERSTWIRFCSTYFPHGGFTVSCHICLNKGDANVIILAACLLESTLQLEWLTILVHRQAVFFKRTIMVLYNITMPSLSIGIAMCLRNQLVQPQLVYVPFIALFTSFLLCFALFSYIFLKLSLEMFQLPSYRG